MSENEQTPKKGGIGGLLRRLSTKKDKGLPLTEENLAKKNELQAIGDNVKALAEAGRERILAREAAADQELEDQEDRAERAEAAVEQGPEGPRYHVIKDFVGKASGDVKELKIGDMVVLIKKGPDGSWFHVWTPSGEGFVPAEYLQQAAKAKRKGHRGGKPKNKGKGKEEPEVMADQEDGEARDVVTPLVGVPWMKKRTLRTSISSSVASVKSVLSSIKFPGKSQKIVDFFEPNEDAEEADSGKFDAGALVALTTRQLQYLNLELTDDPLIRNIIYVRPKYQMPPSTPNPKPEANSKVYSIHDIKPYDVLDRKTGFSIPATYDAASSGEYGIYGFTDAYPFPRLGHWPKWLPVAFLKKESLKTHKYMAAGKAKPPLRKLKMEGMVEDECHVLPYNDDIFFPDGQDPNLRDLKGAAPHTITHVDLKKIPMPYYGFYIVPNTPYFLGGTSPEQHAALGYNRGAFFYDHNFQVKSNKSDFYRMDLIEENEPEYGSNVLRGTSHFKLKPTPDKMLANLNPDDENDNWTPNTLFRPRALSPVEVLITYLKYSAPHVDVIEYLFELRGGFILNDAKTISNSWMLNWYPPPSHTLITDPNDLGYRFRVPSHPSGLNPNVVKEIRGEMYDHEFMDYYSKVKKNWKRVGKKDQADAHLKERARKADIERVVVHAVENYFWQRLTGEQKHKDLPRRAMLLPGEW